MPSCESDAGSCLQVSLEVSRSQLLLRPRLFNVMAVIIEILRSPRARSERGRRRKLGRKDSNLQLAAPKAAALPFGYSPKESPYFTPRIAGSRSWGGCGPRPTRGR